MRGSILMQILLYASRVVHASPFSFPLPNGFPFPSEVALEKLYTTAGGNFTNMPLAPKFDSDSLTSWKLQAFNEFMEVAFFTQLIANITNGVSGYELESESKDYILDTLKTIQAVSLVFPFEQPLSLRPIATRNIVHLVACITAIDICVSKRKCTRITQMMLSATSQTVLTSSPVHMSSLSPTFRQPSPSHRHLPTCTLVS